MQDTTYLAWHNELDRLIGTINLRHNLNGDFIRKYGGHIGYAIHPDFWGQGYGSEMLKLGLVKAKDIGLDRVLITCEESNIASEKVILNNGGVFETLVDGKIKRFWVGGVGENTVLEPRVSP